jgi:hypothetical protein
MSEDRPSFNRGAIRPIECLKAGWRLIADDYWLFLGITLVAVLIGSVVPLGILLGPMMVGLHLCLLRKARGQRVTFEMLFKGFDQFVQSLIATMIMIVPMIVLIVPAYVLLIAAAVATMPQQQPGAPPPQNVPGAFLGAMGLFYLYFFVVMIVFQVLFFFTYPLIADRKMTGVEAVKASIRAAFANFGGVIGVVFLNFLLGFAGTLACCVGAIFVMPVTYAATFIAYRQVFGIEGEAPPAAGDPDQLDHEENRDPERRPREE